MNDAGNVARTRQTVEGTAIGASPAVTTRALTAAPFTRAATLRRFVEAVQELPGVLGVARLGFRHGELSLEVTYVDVVPLTRRLQTLPEFELAIEVDGDGAVRVVLIGSDQPDW